MVSIVTMVSSIVEVKILFSEAFSFSLSRLGLSGVCLKEGQLAAVYEGQDVFVCMMARACATKSCHF